MLSYSGDTQVQVRYLEPGGRGGGALHAVPILNETVLSLRVDPSLVILNEIEQACFKFES